MEAIRKADVADVPHGGHLSVLHGRHLAISIAVRQVLTGKKKYFSICMVAALLVFFASMI